MDLFRFRRARYTHLKVSPFILALQRNTQHVSISRRCFILLRMLLFFWSCKFFVFTLKWTQPRHFSSSCSSPVQVVILVRPRCCLELHLNFPTEADSWETVFVLNGIFPSYIQPKGSSVRYETGLPFYDASV